MTGFQCRNNNNKMLQTKLLTPFYAVWGADWLIDRINVVIKENKNYSFCFLFGFVNTKWLISNMWSSVVTLLSIRAAMLRYRLTHVCTTPAHSARTRLYFFLKSIVPLFDAYAFTPNTFFGFTRFQGKSVSSIQSMASFVKCYVFRASDKVKILGEEKKHVFAHQQRLHRLVEWLEQIR